MLRREAIEIDDDSAAGHLAVWCDANRLEQVLINLIGNAIDAMRGAPVRRLGLCVSRCGSPRGASAAEAASDLPSGSEGWVRIDVLDTGSGLDDHLLGRLFEPFFTSKPSGAGLGLGLVISRDIVREFGGEIDAAPRLEGGARFSVRLPVAPVARPAARSARVMPTAAGVLARVPPQETHEA
jgi:two-component system C4-dicarboxylate transport sensor histidine kinase DctB